MVGPPQSFSLADAWKSEQSAVTSELVGQLAV